MTGLARISPLHYQWLENFQKQAVVEKKPVDVEAFAEKLGLEIQRKNLNDNISGSLKKNKEGRWVIEVKNSDAEVRQRFTIAHEIAHFLLHRKQAEQGITDNIFYRSGLSKQIEFEANKLAADILMPWTLINMFMQDGTRSVTALSKAMDVSEPAMSIRLGVPT